MQMQAEKKNNRNTIPNTMHKRLKWIS